MAVSANGKGKLNSAALESLLKLRLFCNNGTATRGNGPASPGNTMDFDETLSYLQQNDEDHCVFCFRPVYSISEARDTDGGLLLPACLHLVCRGCMPQYHSQKDRCPRCSLGNMDIPISFVVQGSSQPQGPQGMSKSALFPGRTQYPTKLLAFLNDISAQTAQKR